MEAGRLLWVNAEVESWKAAGNRRGFKLHMLPLMPRGHSREMLLLAPPLLRRVRVQDVQQHACESFLDFRRPSRTDDRKRPTT